ncbi:hypothetical protein CkaCkLH20_05177 [Colletotrichum karsti]|uniref:BTB domain-containing protein n=1 Tax=Colletotrichum karsti TaxID=1095194 RepID=A0A9P6I836_9PEZI|nr:uncharacterized protein CkaCkLH20_05177 [Colletotrichum karsti]KAF9877477.1 hypothetical protein CkaCkLH20_05177 [Colletotrichum karsti]
METKPYPLDLVQGLDKYFDSPEYSDVTIRCRARDFYAHRVVLASQSAYFADAFPDDDGDVDPAALLLSDSSTVLGNAGAASVVAAQQQRRQVLDLHDEDPRVVEGVLCFMYHADYRDSSSSSPEDAAVVFNLRMCAAADRFAVSCLKRCAVEKLRAAAERFWDAEGFVRGLEEAYEVGSGVDGETRGVLVAVAAAHADGLCVKGAIMASIRKRPEPPVLSRDGFQIIGDTITVQGDERMSCLKLKKALTHDQTKGFYVAQLRHYGISFPPSASKARVKNTLIEAVREGKCDKVPDAVLRVQDVLRREYEALSKQWKIDCKAWEKARDKTKREDEAFLNCKTPGEKANYDLGRFMELYFLTNGKPDEEKTPGPIALYDLKDAKKVEGLAKRVPGLQTVTCPGRDEKRVTCIGWDKFLLSNLNYDIVKDAYEHEKQKIDDPCGAAMREHREYVAEKREHESLTDQKKPGTSFDVERCKGSYFVQCKAVMNGYDVSPKHVLTMDVKIGKDGLLLAAYDFGMIEGTMLLSASEEKLDSLVQMDCDEDSERRNDDEEDDYGADDPGDDGWKPGQKTLKNTAASRKRPASASSGKGVTKKKKRMLPSLSRRVYFRLRGRETGEGDIHDTPEPGHLDFLDSDCSQFMGLAYEFPYIGKNVEFKGYKVSDSPRKKHEPWSNFSSQAWGYAKAARW